MIKMWYFGFQFFNKNTKNLLKNVLLYQMKNLFNFCTKYYFLIKWIRVTIRTKGNSIFRRRKKLNIFN